MMPRSGDSSLPESVPNPASSPLGDDYAMSQGLDGSANGNGNWNGNGFNKLKLRVPMEKRYDFALSSLKVV